MTGRDLTAGASDAVVAPVQRIVFLYEGEFEGGTVRLSSHLQSLRWNNLDWFGAGDLIGVSGIEENSEIIITSVTVTLSGANLALVSAAIQSARANMRGRLYVGFLSEAGEIIPDPYLAFEGLLSEPVVEIGDQASLISITYENDLVEMLRPREWRFTHESQKVEYPADRGFEHVAALQDKELEWRTN